MSGPITTQGVALKAGSTSVDTGPYTLIPEITNLDGPNESSDDIDTTPLDVTDGYKRFQQGLKDGGAVSVDMNFDPSDAQHQQLYADAQTTPATKRYYRLELTDDPTTPTTITFFAYPKTAGLATAGNSVVKRKFDLKITGKPVVAYHV